MTFSIGEKIGVGKKNAIAMLGPLLAMPFGQGLNMTVLAIHHYPLGSPDPPRGVKNVTYIFGVPLCRVSGPWLYTTYIHIYVGCFTQIHEVDVKMLHYIFRSGKQIYKSNL